MVTTQSNPPASGPAEHEQGIKAMKKVKITIRKDGTQKVEAVNVIGDGCVELTRSFEERLGEVEGERIYKPEHEMTEEEHEQQREYDA